MTWVSSLLVFVHRKLQPMASTCPWVSDGPATQWQTKCMEEGDWCLSQTATLSDFHTQQVSDRAARNCRGSYNTSLITYTIRYQSLGGSFGAHNLGENPAVWWVFDMQFLATKKKAPPKWSNSLGGWRCCFFFFFLLRWGAELILFITRPRIQYH